MVEARHELRLSSGLMQRLRALVTDLPWTTGNLHMEEAIQIPIVDRRLNSESLLSQVCGLLLKHQGPRLVRNTPPPPLQTDDTRKSSRALPWSRLRGAIMLLQIHARACQPDE